MLLSHRVTRAFTCLSPKPQATELSKHPEVIIRNSACCQKRRAAEDMDADDGGFEPCFVVERTSDSSSFCKKSGHTREIRPGSDDSLQITCSNPKRLHVNPVQASREDGESLSSAVYRHARACTYAHGSSWYDQRCSYTVPRQLGAGRD